MTTRNRAQPAARAEPPPQTQPAPAGAARSGSRLAWLDVLRGLAALCVVFNHFGYFVPPRLNNPICQWFNPGDYGVFVFFLISGYIVPASLERKGSVRTFWVSRIFRLYPLYLLAVGLALVLYAVHVGGLPGEGSDPETAVLSQMLMMSNVLAGQNLPYVVWSLSYEMIFYLLLTALFVARIHRRSSRYALAFAAAAVALGGLLPQAYFTTNLWSPRIIALVADLIVLTGLAVAVALRGMPRLLGATLAAMVGLTLLAFNGTWLFPWEALSILALMFTGTMLYRAEQGQYPWPKATAIAIAMLALAITAGLWHSHAWGMSAHAEFIWERCYFMSLFLAGLTFGAGLALRRVTWPRFLTWLGLISYSVYLLHPALIEVYQHLTWTAHHTFWVQLLVDALFLVVLLAVCSVTYLLVERPMQDVGRRLARRLDARFGPDRFPVRMRAPEPALAHGYQHLMITLSGGRRAFAKAIPTPDRGASRLPAALADHAQHPVAAVLAEVGDVTGAGLIDAQGIVQQPTHRRSAQRLGTGVSVGGGNQGPGLLPAQAHRGRVIRVHRRPRHALGGHPADQVMGRAVPVERRQRRQATAHTGGRRARVELGGGPQIDVHSPGRQRAGVPPGEQAAGPAHARPRGGEDGEGSCLLRAAGLRGQPGARELPQDGSDVRKPHS